MIFFCVGVMYSGEYDVCDVTLGDSVVRAVRQRCLLSSFSFRGRENLEGDGMGERKRNPLASLAHYSAATQVLIGFYHSISYVSANKSLVLDMN